MRALVASVDAHPRASNSSSSRVVGRVRDVYAYPLKGARGHRLDEATLARGFGVPGDRAFALMRREKAEEWWTTTAKDEGEKAARVLTTTTGRDPGHHGNKHLFHQLITDPSMSRVEARGVGERGLVVVDAATGEELVRVDDYEVDEEGRRRMERFFGERLETAEAEYPPRLTRAEGFSFANVGGKPNEHVLHINTAPSIERVYARLTENLDTDESLETFALRFRPNLVVESVPVDDEEDADADADRRPTPLLPFDEFDWCGRRLRLGDDVIIRVNEPTIRCPSVRPRYDDPSASVDEIRPDVAVREAFPSLRARVFDREPTTLRERGSYFGVYASVLTDGIVRDGDLVRILDEY